MERTPKHRRPVQDLPPPPPPVVVLGKTTQLHTGEKSFLGSALGIALVSGLVWWWCARRGTQKVDAVQAAAAALNNAPSSSARAPSRRPEQPRRQKRSQRHHKLPAEEEVADVGRRAAAVKPTRAVSVEMEPTEDQRAVQARQAPDEERARLHGEDDGGSCGELQHF